MAGYVPGVDAFGMLSGLGDTLRQGRDDAAADQALKRLPAGFGSQQQNPFAFAVTPAGQASAGPAFPSTPSAPGAPSPQQAYAYQKFLEAGHTPQSASAMVANLSGESGRTLRADAMNNSGSETPGAVNARGSYGIAQWNGDRQFGLLQFARATGGDPRSLDTQIGFVDHELKTQYPDLYAASRDPSAPAASLLQRYVADYERPADVAGGVRQRSQYLGLNYGSAPAAQPTRGVQLAGPVPTADTGAPPTALTPRAATPGFQAIAPQGAPSAADVADAKTILADPVSPANMRAYAQGVLARAGGGAQAPAAAPVDPEQARWQARTAPPAGPAIPDDGAPLPPARPAGIGDKDTAAGTASNAPNAPMPPERQSLPKRSAPTLMPPAHAVASVAQRASADGFDPIQAIAGFFNLPGNVAAQMFAGVTGQGDGRPGMQQSGAVPDGRGGFVPSSNSRFDPATGGFLPGAAGAQPMPAGPAAQINPNAMRPALPAAGGMVAPAQPQGAPMGAQPMAQGFAPSPQGFGQMGGQPSPAASPFGVAAASAGAPAASSSTTLADALALSRSSNPGIRAFGVALANKIAGQGFETPLVTLSTPEQKQAAGLPASLPGVWQIDPRTHALSKVADDPAAQHVLTVETPDEKRAAGLPADLPGTWQVNPRTGAAAQLYDKASSNAATRVQVVGEDEFGRKRYGVVGADGSIKPVGAGASGAQDGVGAAPGGAAAPAARGQQPTGEDYIATLPAERQAQVRAIVEGRAPLPPPTNAFNRETRAQVMNADPSFDAGNAAARVQMRKQFADTTNTKPGGQIAAMNTLAQHLDSLSDQAEALDNWHSGQLGYGTQTANDWNTWLREKAADPRIAKFNATRQLVTGELFKLVKGGQLGEQELARFEQNLNAANSPEQLRATLSEISTLARGRLEALNTQWQGTMGDATPPAALNDPKAAALLDKVFARGHGGADAGAQPGAPQAGAPASPPPRGGPVPANAAAPAVPVAPPQPAGVPGHPLPKGPGVGEGVQGRPIEPQDDGEAPARAPISRVGSFRNPAGPMFGQKRIPFEAVRDLRANPRLRADFDAHYGDGAAATVLGGR